MLKNPKVGLALKIAVFATGLAGIVAEFVLSTLATYLLGDAVFQWTIVMSLMLFSMGVGSRLSRGFTRRLLDIFILTEFTLSLLCAASASLAYALAARTDNLAIVIYGMAVTIGALIGLEIPLVTRLNQKYEQLRTNIASVMENDYYGSLLGGLLFAFFALPHLGLTYTPIALGSINLLVASCLLFSFLHLVEMKKTVIAGFVAVSLALLALGLFAEKIAIYGEQAQFKDKVIYARQTAYQKLVITQWKDKYWLFINGKEQFSTYDEEKYHEPLVHPALGLSSDPRRVLILGGGDGLALREVLKHQDVLAVTLVDLDPEMTRLAATHPVLRKVNRDAMLSPKLKVVNRDAGIFVKNDHDKYGVIIIDLPDPESVDLNHLYCQSFYRRVSQNLLPGGILVTQATSPYFARRAFLCIKKTMEAAGLSTLPMHNQVPTMGEWGWILGIKAGEADAASLKERALRLDFSGISTKFLNQDAMVSMLHFGKGVLEPKYLAEVRVNTLSRPVLQRYYRAGSWGVY